MKWIKDEILGMIYPKRCPLCHQIVTDEKGHICMKCAEKVTCLKEPVCMKCGKEITSADREYCSDCAENHHSFTQGISCFTYSEIMRESIYYFKYRGRQEYARFYGTVMARQLRQKLPVWRPEAIIPVPLHSGRKSKRGYNQAALLAEVAAEQTDVPVNEKVLIRQKNTRPQKALDKAERRENLAGAFRTGAGADKFHRVLLVDDIYTTGSTMDEAARTLQQAGIEEIYFAVVCCGEKT